MYLFSEFILTRNITNMSQKTNVVNVISLQYFIIVTLQQHTNKTELELECESQHKTEYCTPFVVELPFITQPNTTQ